MKRSIQQALLFMTGAALFLLASCSKAPESGKHIPKNAAMVFGFKSKQIQDKLAKDGLTIDKIFETLQQADTSNNYAKALADAKNSGIDLQGDLYFAMVPGEAGGSMKMIVIADVADAAKLEAFVKEKSKKDVQSGKDFKYVVDGNNVIGFTGKTMIGVASVEQPSYAPDTVETAKVENNGAGLLEKLFTLKADESVASIASFKDISKETGDIIFWMSSESLYNMNGANASGMGALMASNMKKITEGAFTTGSANFEAGKIDFNAWSYTSKEIAAIFKKYPVEKINTAAIEQYPSDNIFGYAALNIDLRIVGELLKMMGMDGFANMGLSEARITLDDLLTAFKGEMTLVGSDFAAVPAPTEWDSTATKPQAKWIFSLKVGDKAAFDKVMASPMVAQSLTKQGDEYVPNMPLGEVALSINSKRVLAASDAELLKTYDAGKGKAKLDAEALDNAKGSYGSFYVDVEKIMNAIPTKQMELPDSISTDLKSLLKSIAAKSEQISGEKSHSSGVVTFKDQSKNALSQLFNFTNKMYKYTNEKRKADAAQWGDYQSEEAVAVDSAVAAEGAEIAPPVSE